MKRLWSRFSSASRANSPAHRNPRLLVVRLPLVSTQARPARWLPASRERVPVRHPQRSSLAIGRETREICRRRARNAAPVYCSMGPVAMPITSEACATKNQLIVVAQPKHIIEREGPGEGGRGAPGSRRWGSWGGDCGDPRGARGVPRGLLGRLGGVVGLLGRVRRLVGRRVGVLGRLGAVLGVGSWLGSWAVLGPSWGARGPLGGLLVGPGSCFPGPGGIATGMGRAEGERSGRARGEAEGSGGRRGRGRAGGWRGRARGAERRREEEEEGSGATWEGG